MGTGLNINVITKSGGNIFKGSAAYAFQPDGWNGNNVDTCIIALSLLTCTTRRYPRRYCVPASPSLRTSVPHFSRSAAR